jgi:hypothetical protein
LAGVALPMASGRLPGIEARAAFVTGPCVDGIGGTLEEDEEAGEPAGLGAKGLVWLLGG